MYRVWQAVNIDFVLTNKVFIISYLSSTKAQILLRKGRGVQCRLFGGRLRWLGCFQLYLPCINIIIFNKANPSTRWFAAR